MTSLRIEVERVENPFTNEVVWRGYVREGWTLIFMTEAETQDEAEKKCRENIEWREKRGI